MVGGLSGSRMLIALLIGIALLIVMVLFTKIQAFLAMIITTVVIGVIGGVPLLNTQIETDAGTKTLGIINSITGGFGGTLGSIGIIIGFGVMMGQIFEVTGAAKRMAATFLKWFGRGHEEEALAFTGFLVSIPIFCDSGFIILSPIAKALSRATKKSVVGLGAALAAGLVITHSLVPPTPGPVGVCGIFGIDVGRFILMTIVLAVPMALVAIAWARNVLAKKYYWIVDDNDNIVHATYTNKTSEDKFLMDLSDCPGTLESFMPILLPIILILINTVATVIGVHNGFIDFLIFLGQPIIAVGLGLVEAIFTLGNRLDRDTALKEMEKGMASAGIIMLVTGGGGALGQIIKDTGLGNYMADGLAKTAIPIIILPLVIATVMRFIQGSGTVAMTTAASITAPIIIAANINPYMGAFACCVGSIFFSYFNDSYFWVVNRTLGVDDAKDQMMVWSTTTTLCWLVGVIEVIVLSIFIH